MKPKILLRIAAMLVLFQCFGHTLYVVTWKDTTDPVQTEVFKQMTENKFPFGGTTRSTADYYNGFGYIITIVFLMMAVLLWMLSADTAQQSKSLQKIIFTLAFSLAATGICELIFIIPFPAIVCLTAAILTFLSGSMLKPKKTLV